MAESVALILDTSIMRDIVERKFIDWNTIEGYAKLLVYEGRERRSAKRMRCVVILFKEEIQNKMLNKLNDLIKKRSSTMLFFAIEPEFVGYNREKKNFHERCQVLEEVRRSFGLRNDCEEELISDAFLLITACAKFNNFVRIAILTSDSKAKGKIRDALENLPSLAKKIEVIP